MDLTWPFAESSARDAKVETQSASEQSHVWLRLLSTTDIHAHLLPYDYDCGAEVTDFGLARTATLIEAARAEAPKTLLFDNGDFLQGTPLSDDLALETTAQDSCHPVIAAMNSLGYAAVGLGNHEFNFGLDWLERVLATAEFPVVCSNVVTELCPDDPARDTPLRAPFVVLDTQVHDNHGRPDRLKLGVIGFVPPQITTWDHTHLQGRVETRDIVEAARAHVPVLRDHGADLVIALAHTGIMPGAPHTGMENAALALAGVVGIDAIIAGHTHQVFPDPQLALKLTGPGSVIDHTRGTLRDVPAVMAGYRGSHLGVLDMRLTRANGSWRITAHRSQARPVHAIGAVETPAAEDLCALARPAHLKTLDRNAEPLGHSAKPMHSYLARVRACPALAPVLSAQKEALSQALAQHPEAALPILSATPPFRTGGHAGPRAYTDIPAGPLEMRHVGDLYPFPNTLVGLKVTGADIADWLERAASCFRQINPGLRCQQFWDTSFAGHAFDTIAGVTYQIDLSRPARYDARGQKRDTKANRIVNLRLNGAALRADQPVLLATNSFRAFGGGPYNRERPYEVVHHGGRQIKELVADHLRACAACPTGIEQAWSFVPIDGASVLFETGPGLRDHPEDITGIGATDLGDSEDGFMRLDIPL
ncbi:MAG: bifunctional 2',3'-cyclic-nucleotide 2'-phosphodiesterase/3'-nucleotidase [Pseudomonadota bacterium]